MESKEDNPQQKSQSGTLQFMKGAFIPFVSNKTEDDKKENIKPSSKPDNKQKSKSNNADTDIKNEKKASESKKPAISFDVPDMIGTIQGVFTKSSFSKPENAEKEKEDKNARSNSDPLDLGKPLEDVSQIIQEAIQNKMPNEDADSKEKESSDLSNLVNVVESIKDSINQKVQTETQTQGDTQIEEEEIEEEIEKEIEEEEKNDQNDNKGELEKYITDNILITMVDQSHQTSTAGTQTDQNYKSDSEEEEEEEETKEEINDIPPIQVTRFSQEELQEALQKQLTTQQLPPQEMREAVIDYARKQSIYKLMEEDYDTASKIDDAIAANLQSLKDDHHNIEADMLNNHLKHRLTEAENSKSYLQDEWRKKIRSFKENEENELQKITERHEQERRLFENHWANSATLMPFSKPSSSLLQLRSMQKAFALSHDFTNARQLKISAERKQKEESIEASKKASKSMRKEYLNLVKKQQQELSCFNDLCNRKLGRLEAQRDSELKINENVRFQLASRVNKSRLIKKPMVMMSNPVRTDTRSASVTPVTGVMTYRTRSQFANYRQSVDMKMLDVKINDLQSIMKPLTPAVQKSPKNQKNKKNQTNQKKRENTI